MRKLILSAFIVFLLLVGTIVDAKEVTLQWDASIDAAYIEGYRIYMTETEGQYILVSGNPTENSLAGEVGKDVLVFVVTVPDEPCRRWFVVTAYNNLESDKSNEVCYSTMKPAPPTMLRGSPSVCKGDFDFNGSVDGIDLAIFSKNFGRTDCSGGQ